MHVVPHVDHSGRGNRRKNENQMELGRELDAVKFFFSYHNLIFKEDVLRKIFFHKLRCMVL